MRSEEERAKERARLLAELAKLPPGRLYQTIFDLAETYNRVSLVSRNMVSQFNDANFLGPAIVLRSFAAELLLKFLVSVQHPTKTYAELVAMGLEMRGHLYSELFNRVAPLVRDRIAQRFESSSGSSTTAAQFRDRLIEIGDKPFVEWRYPFEDPTHRFFDIELFDVIVDSIGSVAMDEIKKARVADGR
jgi:hypothetical protein